MEATIVSILPYELKSTFPSVVPPYVIVPKAEENDFVVLHIEDGHGFLYLDESRGSFTIPHTGEQIAGSVANDHIRDSVWTTATAFPGIKALPGHHEKKDIKTKFPDLLPALEQAQRLWFGEMVKAADDTWTDPNARGKSQSISDLQRTAARRLGLNKEWLVSHRTDQTRCPACTSFIPGEALICPLCHTIVNEVEYNKKFKKVS